MERPEILRRKEQSSRGEHEVTGHAPAGDTLSVQDCEHVLQTQHNFLHTRERQVEAAIKRVGPVGACLQV